MAMDDKIRKLMALAEHPGTSPQEASAAAAMAASLALQYNIDMAALKPEDKKAKNFTIGLEHVLCSARDRQSLLILADGVGSLYGTRCVVPWVPPNNHVYFVGQDHNVALSATWLKYLWETCKRCNTDYRKTQPAYLSRTTADKYKMDQSFRIAFTSTVNRRLYDKLTEMKMKGVSSTGTALVVVDWYEAERKEVKAWMDAQMKLKSTKSKKKELDYDAYTGGTAAGKQVGLSDQIAGATRSSQRSLN